MEAQQTPARLDPLPVETSQPPTGTEPSPKPAGEARLRGGRPVPHAAESGNPKLRPVNRDRIVTKRYHLGNSLGARHPARAMWDLLGRLDLSGFHCAIRSRQGEKGRPSNDPRMLAGVWLYAYSQGISSAREIQRQMDYEPGLVWLCAANPVNHHTLSDFRVNHKNALDGLFQNLLVVLEDEGFVDMSQIMHDGTKVRANAGVDTFRHANTIGERHERAKQLLAKMGDPREDNRQARTRKQAAQERVAREKVEKMAAAARQMEQINLELIEKGKTAAEVEKTRVSVVEREARMMHHGDNAILPSYNVQLSTESSNRIIVGMHLSQCSCDAQALVPAMNEVERNMGRDPDQLVVDGGFTNKDNIVAMDGRSIDLIGSLPNLDKKRTAGAVAAGIEPAFGVQFFIFQEQTGTLACPAGKALEYKSQSVKRGNKYEVYRAKGSDCQECEFQKQCCPKKPEKGRGVSVLVQEDPLVANFRKKMESEEARKIYKRRGPVAEFPNAWIKDKIKLRKYRLRGMGKAEIETLWACLAYNAKQWIRLSWGKKPALACAA